MSPARLALVVLLAPAAAAQIVFQPPQPHPLTHPVLAPLAGDLDLDGLPDVAVQGAFAGPFQGVQLSVLLATGGGGLGAPTLKGLFLVPVGEGQIVDVVDLDGPVVVSPDGLPDVLLGGVGFGTGTGVGWLSGKGDGTFGPFFSGFNISTPGMVDVAAIDLEGDGDMDFACLDGGASIFIPGQLVQCLNNGFGGFGISSAGSTLTASTFLALTDLDDDGRADALCNNNFSGSLSLFMGSPLGGFQPATSVALGGSPGEMQAADLDADGDADILVANAGLDVVQVLADGGGTLGVPAGYAAGHQPRRLVVGDLDGDGAADALVSAANGDVVVLQGGGDGTLAQVATVSSTLASLGLALADLDADGDLDAAVARGGTPGGVDVLLNATYPAGSPFTDLGHALAGGQGYPIQIAGGTLLAGQPFSFDLLQSKPGLLAVHVVGLSPLFAPYKGGTLVPTPNLLNVLVTDAAGEVHLAGPWPAGGSGATLWLQFWITDAGGVKGKAASNAVQALIP